MIVASKVFTSMIILVTTSRALLNGTPLLLIVVSLLVACVDFAGEDETLTPLPFTVTARGTPFYGKNGIHAPGPVNQLCVGFLNRPMIRRGSSPDRALMETAEGKRSELRVVLIDNDSARVPLQFAGTKGTGSEQSACFENNVRRDVDRRYYRGELVSDGSTDIYGIRWASGKNVRSLHALADNR